MFPRLYERNTIYPAKKRKEKRRQSHMFFKKYNFLLYLILLNVPVLVSYKGISILYISDKNLSVKSEFQNKLSKVKSKFFIKSL